MTKELSQQQALRYCRQILLPSFDIEGQEALLNASILQIGVGGLGCASAQYLVAAGIGTLTLVDDDQVEITNLQRQILHGEADVGKSKCQSAYENLVILNTETQINLIENRLSESEMHEQISAHDLVLDCTDNLATRGLINRVCYQHQTPLVSGAAIRMEGQITSFNPKEKGPCYACLSRFFGEQNLSCVESGVLSPIVGIIGTMQALEAIKLLSNLGTSLQGRLMLFDALAMSWNEFTIPKKEDCPVCSNHE